VSDLSWGKSCLLINKINTPNPIHKPLTCGQNSNETSIRNCVYIFFLAKLDPHGQLAVSPTFGHLSIFVGVHATLVFFFGLSELPNQNQNNVDN